MSGDVVRLLVRLRRAMAVLASAGGNTVPAIARRVQGDEDAIRSVIQRFNETGLGSLNRQWCGGGSRHTTGRRHSSPNRASRGARC